MCFSTVLFYNMDKSRIKTSSFNGSIIHLKPLSSSTATFIRVHDKIQVQITSLLLKPL